MHFELSEKQTLVRDRVRDFMTSELDPARSVYRTQLTGGDRWQPIPIIETLKARAKKKNLWNIFMPPAPDGALVDDFQFTGERLTNLEYALCAEEMGRLHWAPEVFNCSAPDSGNMEVLLRYGTMAQKQKWLRPLMDGDTRSAFLMTEPDVASSDATNINTSIVTDGDDYLITGTKWWSSGIGDSRCSVLIVMGKTSPGAEVHRQQSMIIVPANAPGVTVERLLPVYGFDDAPHGHGLVRLENVRVPRDNIILGEGRGFEIAQGRLGPGRIHHCMRIIGAAEEALAAMARRLQTRTAFGRVISDYSVWHERIARGRIDIEMTRLLCLKAADKMDRHGNKAARNEIAMIKVQAPQMATRIIDDAIQAHGAAGVSDDFELAASWASIRALRIADGPDEVHVRAIAKAEFNRHPVDQA